jgi:hypothetical protein
MVQQGSLIMPKPPSAGDCAPAGAPAGIPTVPLVVGGLAVAGIAAYFILR